MQSYVGFGPYDALSIEQKLEFAWRRAGLSASGMLHGEQGALPVASQLTSYAASQTFDEARHVTFGINSLEQYVARLDKTE